ncbi:MAG: RsmE family RNA methyltransferase [Acidimicrobiia bacterium]
MAHIPHLYLPEPWAGPTIDLVGDQRHHLTSVLRLRPGEACSYTDGAGTIGDGTFDGTAIQRGRERVVAETSNVTLAVAPPANKDRLRFLVEKVAELGACRIRWVSTRYGQGRPPRADKSHQWAVGALEQSRGARLTIVDDDMVSLDQLTGTVLAADQSGGPVPAIEGPVTLLIGPEGGWAPGEIPESIQRIGLGDRVLRTETAAVVGLYVMQAERRTPNAERPDVGGNDRDA